MSIKKFTPLIIINVENVHEFILEKLEIAENVSMAPSLKHLYFCHATKKKRSQKWKNVQLGNKKNHYWNVDYHIEKDIHLEKQSALELFTNHDDQVPLHKYLQ